MIDTVYAKLLPMSNTIRRNRAGKYDVVLVLLHVVRKLQRPRTASNMLRKRNVPT